MVLMLVAACAPPSADDSAAASNDANLTEGTSFTTCAPDGSNANVVYASDGKSAAYVACPATLRRIDLTSHATTEVATFDDAPSVKTSDGGKHFYVLDAHTQTLHLYSWDGSPEITLTGVSNFVMSPDGTRIVSYAEKRLPIGQYSNVYHLDVRVRSLDGTLDASGSLEEDRAGNYVHGDAAVRDVVFAPDGSHVGFVRAHDSGTLDVFVSKFDIASKQFSDGIHLGWATETFPETYDGTTMAMTKVAFDGSRYFTVGTQSTRLANIDTHSYYGVYCTARAGSGLVYLAAQADYAQPVRLLRWDAASGESTIATFADGSPEKPAACPTIAANGELATYESSSSARPAVIALSAASTPHVLASASPFVMLGSDHVLAFSTAGQPELVDPASGTVTDVPFPVTDGVRLSSGYSALLPNGRIVTIGSKTIDAIHLKDEESVWTSTGGAFTRAATLASDNMMGGVKIVPLPGDKGFAVEHGDAPYQHTITTLWE